MRLKLAYLPLLLCILSSIAPLLCQIFDTKHITFLPDLFFIICLYLIFLFNSSISRIPLKSLSLFFFILFIYLLSLFSGSGIGSGGIILIILYIIFYLTIFNSLSLSSFSSTAYGSLFIIYSFHILYIFCEFILRILGFDSLFIDFFASASDTNIIKYKDYNSAAFLWFIGFPYSFHGLKSMILGSQIAGQLSVFATLMVAPVFNFRNKIFTSFRPYLFLLSLILVPITATNTTLLIAVLFVLFLIFMSPLSRLNNTYVRLFLIAFIVLFSSNLLSLFSSVFKMSPTINSILLPLPHSLVPFNHPQFFNL